MPHVTIIVSVDWEGRSLLAENANAMRAFRRTNADVPLHHFLNPAYYVKAADKVGAVSETIRSLVAPQDRFGMHLHAWASLLSVAGVEPMSEPTFLKTDKPLPKQKDDWDYFAPEPGYDVPLEAYSALQIEQILRTSVSILADHGFERLSGFRAGGWMAGDQVRAALVGAGFRYDCSGVNPRYVLERFGAIPLHDWLSRLWPDIDDLKQPYRLPGISRSLWEVPNNASLIDYTPENQLPDLFARHVAALREDPRQSRILSTGFHQETARVFLPELNTALLKIRALAEQWSVPLKFAASPDEALDEIEARMSERPA